MGNSERGLVLVKVAACGFKLPDMKIDNIVYITELKSCKKRLVVSKFGVKSCLDV